jgi:hypothetical protein
VKKPGRRVKRIKLAIVKESRKKEKDIRAKKIRDDIIGKYQMKQAAQRPQGDRTLS